MADKPFEDPDADFGFDQFDSDTDSEGDDSELAARYE